MYQDTFIEIECSECRGAGFFGDGPTAEVCGVCEGKGVIVTDEILPVAAIAIREAA